MNYHFLRVDGPVRVRDGVNQIRTAPLLVYVFVGVYCVMRRCSVIVALGLFLFCYEQSVHSHSIYTLPCTLGVLCVMGRLPRCTLGVLCVMERQPQLYIGSVWFAHSMVTMAIPCSLQITYLYLPCRSQLVPCNSLVRCNARALLCSACNLDSLVTFRS